MSTIVTRNPDLSRFELTVEGQSAGILDYRLSDGIADMVHTEVYPQFGGRGLGTELVRSALDEARAQGWTVIPSCWFVRDYLAAHPEDADLLA